MTTPTNADEQTLEQPVTTGEMTPPEPEAVLVQKPDDTTSLETGEKPDENTEVAEISLVTPSFAFKGEFPEVAFADGVNVGELTKNDPGKPLYVVRPLAVLNAVSNNDLEYDRELIEEIKRQVHAKKPPARQGHIPKENINWEFPDDVGLWVGAEMFGDTLYGKCYIYPNTPFHQMVTKRKAAGSTLSNSIWGDARWVVKPNGKKTLRGLDLESIDFAPAERASLQALGGAFDTTSEMSDKPQNSEGMMADNKDVTTPISEMDADKVCEMLSKDQRSHVAKLHIAEMEPSAVYEMLPAGHRQAVHDCYVKEFGQKEPTAEMKTINSTIAEMKASNEAMQQQIAEFRRKEFEGALDATVAQPFASWNVKSATGVAALNSAKDTLRKLVVAEMAAMDGGANIDNLQAAASAAWKSYEPQAAALKQSLTGGSVLTGLVAEQGQGAYGYDPKTGRYSDDAAKSARAKVMGG